MVLKNYYLILILINICCKANVIKAFLQRNHSCCPRHVKSNCFKTLLRPVLEYAASIWSPFTHYDITRLERVQRRAACSFCYERLLQVQQCSAMITALNWLTLEQSRNYLKLVMLYKITRGLVEIPSLSLIPLFTATRGHVHRFRIPSARVNSYLHSFLPSTVKLWNRLPEHLVSTQSVEHFRELILNTSHFLTTPTIIS